MCVMIVSV